MSGVFQNIDPPHPRPPASVYPPLLVRGEDTLFWWKGDGGSILWKTPDTALYSTHVSTLWSYLSALRMHLLCFQITVVTYSAVKDASFSETTLDHFFTY
jgi:hypothetical protein